MKKFLSVLICLPVLLSVCILPASAAGSGSISGAASITAGNTSEYTVNISGCADATSVSVSVSLGNNLSVVSGTWLKSGSLTNFDTSKNKGALSGLSSPDINGNIFKVTVKGVTPSAAAQSVSVTVTVKNGSAEIFNQTFTKSVAVSCATHSYGSWSKLNDNQHTRTCSACGHVETVNHSWNGGTVTKNATCKETGTKEYTCTACGAKKTETIAKTNTHSFSGYKTTKAPTCTAEGSETATCSVCGTATSRSIPATGHNFGAWKTTKEATCTAEGTQTRTCSKCTHSETKSIAALGHNFTSPTVTKQPTCTEAGEQSGKCTRCGETTTQAIKPTGHNFGSWEDETPATCTSGGTQKRVCSKCKAEEQRTTKALGHDFDNPVVVKEATLYSSGLLQGKCKRCGETTTQATPCTAKDGNTGITVETAEGVFPEGAQLAIQPIDGDSEVYKSAKNILSDVTDEFTLYDISALLNGEKIQPNGTVKTVFTLPENYGDEIKIYRIADDGTANELECELSADCETATAELDSFGLYAVCNLEKDEKPATDKVMGSLKNNGMLWIIISVAAVVIALAVLLVVVLKIRKKK